MVVNEGGAAWLEPLAEAADAELGEMLIVSASASSTSRSELLARCVSRKLANRYARVDHLRLRLLPAGPLLQAKVDEPAVASAVAKLAAAQGILLITPTYKGSYSGLLKVFLDLLPQYALKGKHVLPIAMGGSLAHMQMLDYALRPVLQTMWPAHVGQSCFLVDSDVTPAPDGAVSIGAPAAAILDEALGAFERTVRLGSGADLRPALAARVA